MADRDFIIRHKNGEMWDNLYPRTKNSNVFNNQNQDLDSQLEVLRNTMDTIVQEGSNQNGDYVIFSNGFAICWRKITVDRDTGSDFGNHAKPIEFKEGIPHFSGLSIDSSSSSGNDRIDAWRMVFISYYDSWTFGRNYSDFSAWKGSGNLSIILWGAGFVDL